MFSLFLPGFFVGNLWVCVFCFFIIRSKGPYFWRAFWKRFEGLRCEWYLSRILCLAQRGWFVSYFSSAKHVASEKAVQKEGKGRGGCAKASGFCWSKSVFCVVPWVFQIYSVCCFLCLDVFGVVWLEWPFMQWTRCFDADKCFMFRNKNNLVWYTIMTLSNTIKYPKIWVLLRKYLLCLGLFG